MASPNSTFTELVTTTMRHRKREVADNVTNHNAFLKLMREKGNVKKYAPGGTEIVLPHSYQENATFQRFYGYDTLNVGASDVLTSSKWDWTQQAIHVTASGREVRINSGKEQMINLVKARTDVAIATASNNMSADVYSDGAAANQIGGLAHLITSDGTGTVGGIAAGTYTYWKNKFQELSAPTTYATVRNEMTSIYLSLVRGTDKPDIIVSTHDLYKVLDGGMSDLQRYASAKTGEMGFTAMMFKDVPIIFDSDATNFATTGERQYFLNTKYLFLFAHPEADWTQDDERVPVNQDAIVIPIYNMCQMATNGRKFQGRTHDLA